MLVYCKYQKNFRKHLKYGCPDNKVKKLKFYLDAEYHVLMGNSWLQGVVN